jgi:hypothetical protein
VKAFERLSNPDKASKKASDEYSKMEIRRSNEGCKRTKILCPRCKVEWNYKLDGNPDYFYNILMTGLKSFHCSTCLF